jgi:hypothetical protein
MSDLIPDLFDFIRLLAAVRKKKLQEERSRPRPSSGSEIRGEEKSDEVQVDV